MIASVTNLSKKYKNIEALKSVNMEVPKGKIYGLIGPNGAGKSTLIKAFVGSLEPTAGEVTVLGMNPLKEKWKVRKELGYMPQHYALYDDLSAMDNIMFFGSASPMKNLRHRAEEILEFTELTDRANDAVGNFSGGMKKRVSLACALIHHPKVIFLDEPTAAIDPHLKLRSWALFRKLADEGKTLFISTHLMDEALLCDKITILRQGEIITTDTPKNILQKGNTKIKITYTNGEIKEENTSSAPHELARAFARLKIDENVSLLETQQDDLEKIILSIINQKN